MVLLGPNIVTPSLILCMDYITSHEAVCERVPLRCAAFEVTTAYMRKKSACLEFKDGWDAEQIYIQCKARQYFTTMAGGGKIQTASEE